jgi:hypothetical protein
MRSSIGSPALPETLSGRSVFAVASRKKSMRGSTPFISFLACAIGLPVSVESTFARRSLSATTSSRKRTIASRRCRIGMCPQAGCEARARSYFAFTLFASSAGSVAMVAPVAGLVTFKAMASSLVWTALFTHPGTDRSVCFPDPRGAECSHLCQ